MKKNNCFILSLSFLASVLSAPVYAKSTNNGACPTELLSNSACVEIVNTGNIDLHMKAAVLYESGLRIATAGQRASYVFEKLHGQESIALLPNHNHALLDASCKLFDWAAQLAEGKKAMLSNLTPGIYSYKFGYTHDASSGKYTIVNCG